MKSKSAVEKIALKPQSQQATSPMKETPKPEEKRMRTVSFQINDDEFQVLQAISARFYQGCFRGDRPMDIRDLARLALLAKTDQMSWVLQEKPVAAGRVISGPWPPRAVAK